MIIAATKGCELLWAIAIRERPYPKEIMDKAIDTLMKMLTCLQTGQASLQAGQISQADKMDKNMAGINGVSASVEILKPDLAKTNNRMDSTCKT